MPPRPSPSPAASRLPAALRLPAAPRAAALWAAALVAAGLGAPAPAEAKPKIHVAFLWHLHQPIYWPYEPVTDSISKARYGFALQPVFTDRSGPYSGWPVDAVQAARDAGLPHGGAQVSFSGSLAENLDALAGAGIAFQGWKGRWAEGAAWKTSLGNPRLDLVRFGYHHPLMALFDGDSLRRQVALHSHALSTRMAPGLGQSKGMFPPETGFAPEMIPDLAAAGVQWILVDNVHFDRARPDYPWVKGSNLAPPNPADQRNTGGSVTWLQLKDLWAPSKVAVPWGYQPHRARHLDPATGAASSIIVVPAARYEGNEDARGGFGALQYEKVLAQHEPYNTDDAHPMLVVLHHDGDNYGGGTESYYHGNFAALLDWLKANPDRFELTTVQDYLDRFPPAADDFIHVEPGSWSGADNGDPEFAKWNGDPRQDGYSADRHSWSVVTAGANRVATAQANRPEPAVADVAAGTGDDVAKAWHFFLNAQTSCYWYWDYSENGAWDSHPTRAVNLALDHADKVLSGTFADPVPPSIYPPQREPYNPGGMEWADTPMPSDFEVWTYAYDVSGLSSVRLLWRVDPDGKVDEGLRYDAAGFSAVAMEGASEASRTDPAPRVKAARYAATVTGVRDALVDYFVEAVDGKGNVARSALRHVRVGAGGGTGPGDGPWSPDRPCREDVITICGAKAGFLHWAVDGWTLPPEALWPAGTTPWGDGKAVETPLADRGGGRFCTDLGPVGQQADVIDFVFRWADGTWDNHGGADWHLPLPEDCPEPGEDPGTPADGAEEARPDAGVGDGGPEAGGDAAGTDPGGPGEDGGDPPDAGGDGGGQASDAPGTDLPGTDLPGTDPGRDAGRDAGKDPGTEGGGADGGDGGPGGGGCSAGPAGAVPGPSLALLLALAGWVRRRRHP